MITNVLYRRLIAAASVAAVLLSATAQGAIRDRLPFLGKKPAPAAAPAAAPERSPRPLQPASGRFESLRRLPPEAARAAISQALEESGGIRSLAAANLGIDPSTLWRKMKKLGMR